jgi:mycothiol synthase
VSGSEIVVAGPSDREAIIALDRAIREATGHPALGEAVWRDLEHPAADSIGLLARDGELVVAYLHVARSETFSPRHWALGLARDPAEPRDKETNLLLEAAEHQIAARGGGRAILWLFDPFPADDALLASNHFDRQRDLYQMRVTLPLTKRRATAGAEFPDDIELRTFVPGHDEAAWLEVNNRAFANHPEQGGWIRETLARRMAEPWFDPSLFLLAFDRDGLAGFNWLKVHDGDGRDPRIGEIFVIGVDPSRQGRGLGRALAVEGLARLADRGITIGMLYVAAENTGALTLYRSLGFAVHRLDRAYEHDVADR